jgi:hypothetical protein
MNKLFKAALLCLVVAALVWLVTLWHWQTAGRDVPTPEIVGQLVVLPVVLSAVLLFALWGVARLRVSAAKPLPVASGARPSPLAAPDAGRASDPRMLGLALLQAAVQTSAGATPAQAFTQLRSGDIRPALDPDLQDVDGAPVFTARMPDLDVIDLRERLPGEVSDRVVRALVLLQRPADELLARVSDLAQAWTTSSTASDRSVITPRQEAEVPSMKAHLSGMAPVDAGAAVHRQPSLPRLTVRLAVPSAWTEPERERAAAWLRMRCTELADESDAWRAAPPVPHVHALDHADALWALLDQQTLQWSRETSAQWCLVLVADSALDAPEIERRQAVGELFTGAHQTGRIPGEAAAGLLLSTLDWPGLGEQEPRPVRLSRPARQRRDKSADAAGRVGPAVLQDAMAQALSVCGALPGDLVHVVADADHRASRTAELFEALQGLAPDLDPMVAVTRVGEACGDLGLASALVPVALAAGLAQQDDSTGVTLAVHVQATHERVAVALLPWTWTPPVAAQAAT